LLSKKNSKVVLFLLGEGPAIPMIRVLIREEFLEKNVIVHSSVPFSEVPKYISIADVCIVPLPNNPYWIFQSPLKLLEYLAMEKVAIITDIPAHRSVIGDATCGIYIKSTEPLEISRSLEFAYENWHCLESWGKSGSEIIERNYTWCKIALNLEEYLRSLSNKKGLSSYS
jgi:glycosyltransferase involved in cell wall biosynthesis